MDEKNEYQPNESERAMVDAIQSEINELAAQQAAVLKAIARANKLNGNWTWDGSKFVKQA